MDIAIIGAGNVGTAVAVAASRAGHMVTISSNDPADAVDLAEKIGGTAATTNADAVRDAEVVVLAVGYPAMADLVDSLAESLDGKVVVDVSNRVNPADPGHSIDGDSAAEQIQAKLPRASVVKAFNTAFVSRQVDPNVEGVALDGFVAGDDADAKAKVLALVESMGFIPIDAGSLAMARALEAMAALNISLNITQGWTWQTGWKLVGPKAS